MKATDYLPTLDQPAPGLASPLSLAPGGALPPAVCPPWTSRRPAWPPPCPWRGRGSVTGSLPTLGCSRLSAFAEPSGCPPAPDHSYGLARSASPPPWTPGAHSPSPLAAWLAEGSSPFVACPVGLVPLPSSLTHPGPFFSQERVTNRKNGG